MKVLIELSRLDFETLEPETIRLCGKMDWDEFLRLAVKQKVMLVIEKNLDIFINNNPQVHIPYVYLMKIRVLSKGLRDRLKAIDDEIERLFQIFNHNHLKVVLFKGASMKKIYGEEYFRIYNDIDLLVDLYDVERIHDILLQHQYIYDSDEIVNGKILEEKCRQVFNCIGNYIRISEGITLKIDLHKADCYNTARTKCNPQKIPSAHLFHNSKHLSLLHLLHTMKKISNRYSELKELFLYQQKF